MTVKNRVFDHAKQLTMARQQTIDGTSKQRREKLSHVILLKSIYYVTSKRYLHEIIVKKNI